MNRGLTLIEMLVSIALLSALMTVLTGWLQVSLRATQTVGEQGRWEAAARQVLQRIQEDVNTFDWQAETSAGRIRVEAGELLIHTRSKGAVEHTYVLDPRGRRLRRHVKQQDGSLSTSLLLSRVARWDVALDRDIGLLVVTITGPDSTVCRRSFVLP